MTYSQIKSILGENVREIETIAKEERVSLKWFSSLNEFTSSLQNNKRDMNTSDKICSLHYYGHGEIGRLLLRPNFFPWNPDELSVGPEVFKSSYFGKYPEVYLHTCHSASTHANKVQKSLAEQISIAINGYVLGYDGRVDYAPVADNKMPVPGNTISEDAAINKSNGTYDNYKVEPISFGNRINIAQF